MDSQKAWDTAADAWREFVRSGADYYRLEVHGPALLASCGEVAGLEVLDLGCGEGYFSRALAQKGARVTAIDVSQGQLQSARQEENAHPLSIDYVHLDARAIAERWPVGTFDLITGCMALADFPDLERVVQGASALMRPDGRLVFSAPHPCTDTPVREWERDATRRKLSLKIDRYFDTGQDVMHWTMPRLKYQWSSPMWRRTLQEWCDLLTGAGFVITRLVEPRPTREQVQANPKLEDCARLPYFLIFETRKRGS